jgi:hypothetical protein
MMKKRIHQSTVRVARRRMNDKARGLVDHQEVFVLEDHVQGDILSQHLKWRRRRDPYRHHLPHLQGFGLFGIPVVHPHVTVLNEPDTARTGEPQAPSQELVQSLLKLFLNDQSPNLTFLGLRDLTSLVPGAD